MRRRFRDLRQVLAIPIRHGISAFVLDFNSMNTIKRPTTRPSILADVTPITRWDWDVLQQEEAYRVRKVVNQVKEMSARSRFDTKLSVLKLRLTHLSHP
jgi:hypothetical protein